MELTKWLDAERGRAKALAEHVGRSKVAVTLWRRDGVPMPLMREVSAFTKGAVPVSTLLKHALECADKRSRVVNHEQAPRTSKVES